MRKAKSVFCIVLPQALSPSTIVNPLYSKIFNYLPLREREREKNYTYNKKIKMSSRILNDLKNKKRKIEENV